MQNMSEKVFCTVKTKTIFETKRASCLTRPCIYWFGSEPRKVLACFKAEAPHYIPLVKVKVKLSLCLTKHHAMKTYWGSRGIAPVIYRVSVV
jgi:hypothetical protein